jgi:hypothetical protein
MMILQLSKKLFFLHLGTFPQKKVYFFKLFFTIKKKLGMNLTKDKSWMEWEGLFFHMLLFPHMQACIQGYITYEGGGVQQSKREQARAHAPPTRSEKLRAFHQALASLHMWLMGKTRQIIVGRPTLHSDLHGLLLSK